GEDQRRTSEIVVSGEIGEFVNVLVSVAAGDIWESGALEIESRSRSVDWSGSGAAVEIKSHVRPVIRGRSGIPNQRQPVEDSAGWWRIWLGQGTWQVQRGGSITRVEVGSEPLVVQ